MGGLQEGVTEQGKNEQVGESKTECLSGWVSV